MTAALRSPAASSVAASSSSSLEGNVVSRAKGEAAR